MFGLEESRSKLLPGIVIFLQKVRTAIRVHSHCKHCQEISASYARISDPICFCSHWRFVDFLCCSQQLRSLFSCGEVPSRGNATSSASRPSKLWRTTGSTNSSPTSANSPPHSGEKPGVASGFVLRARVPCFKDWKGQDPFDPSLTTTCLASSESSRRFSRFEEQGQRQTRLGV